MGFHDDARVGDALRGLLPLLVAESHAQGMLEPVPVVLGAPGQACQSGADRTTAVKALARGVERGLGGENSVVDPHVGTRRCGEPEGGVRAWPSSRTDRLGAKTVAGAPGAASGELRTAGCSA